MSESSTPTKEARKITPGNWHVMDSGPVKELFNSTVIVSDQIEDAIICSMGGDVPEAVENARQIANLPDLLESHKQLQEALAEVITQCPCTLRQRQSGHLLECWAPKLNELLTRAKEIQP